jgi:hypothetical protein
MCLGSCCWASRRQPLAARAGERPRQAPGNSAALWGTEGEAGELDEAKVHAAMIKLQESQGILPEDAEPGSSIGYHGLGADGTTVTAEEMEAYRRFRTRAADPMADMGHAGRAKADGYDMV